MNLLLIEDEYPAAERLALLVRRVAPTARVLAVVESVAQGVAWLRDNPAPDLILSDIQLADGLSFEIFEQAVVRTPIIFTTSYDEYALRAFRVHSLDYLLKPIKEEELRAALQRFRERAAQPTTEAVAGQQLGRLEALLDALPRPASPMRAYKSRFLVRQREQLIPVPTPEIAYFISRHETTTLVTHTGARHLVDYTLEQVQELLDPARFFRLNRQTLAAAAAIRRIDLHFNGKLKLELLPEAPDEVLVSREKSGTFRSWLEEAA
jgi:two-component system, LytTR family, response regulator